MRVIRANDHRRMRWKNGLGETTEIAVWPEGASVDDFDWRISTARVEADGPFSPFEGIDRTLTVLHGAGLRLSVEGAGTIELSRATPPHGFAGDRPTGATLVAGPVTDLNVMTRRSRLWHRVRRLALYGSMALASDAATVLVLCTAGSAFVASGEAEVHLGLLDTAWIDAGPQSLTLTSNVANELFVIEIYPR